MKRILSLSIALAAFACAATAQTLSNYQSTVMGEMPNYYFTFDNGSLTSITNGVTLLSSPASFTQFTFDIFNNPNDSAFFSGLNDALVGTGDGLINGGGTSNLTSTASGTVTFLFKTLDPGFNTGQRIIFSCGGSTTNHNALQLFIENTNPANGDTNSLKFRFGDTTTTILPVASLIPDTWYYFAFTYTEASTTTNKATWYLGRPGGILASGLTTNAPDCVAGDGTDFYIGNNPALSAGFRNPGSGTVDEFAIWNRQLSGSEVQAQFATLPSIAPPPRSAYENAITGQTPSYLFNFDGSYLDSVGGSLAVAPVGPTVGFTYDYFDSPTGAVNFVTGGDAVTNNSNLLNGGGTYTGTPGSGKGSLSFLFHTLPSYVNQGNRYLYTAGGGPGTSNRFELFFNTFSSASQPDSLKLGFGDSSTTILATNAFLPSTWYYFAMTYDESLSTKQVTWWLGVPGQALKSGTLNALNGSLAGQGNLFIFGDSTNLVSNSFRNSTPSGQGRMQEFAIWHRTLSGTEVTNQFNALVSTPVVTAPLLSITLSGSNVILTWPSSTDPGYNLQSTADLTSPSWGSAGSASIVGNQYAVTNTLTPATLFYRLMK